MLGQTLVALTSSAMAFAAPATVPRQERGLPAVSLPIANPLAPASFGSSKIAVTIDPNLQRDSCVTANALIDGRVLWICRDSLSLKNETLGQYAGFFTSSSASWSNQTTGTTSSGGSGNQPKLDFVPLTQGQQFVTAGYLQQLTQYGGPFPLPSPYLPYAADQCPDSGGGCYGGRYIEWPDASMYVTDVASDGTTTGYLYTTAAAGGGNLTDNFPGTTLYKITYTPTADIDTLPEVTMIAEHFFPRFGFNYGAFGGVVSPTDGLLYLWGETYDFSPAAYNISIGLARVAIDSIENPDAYSYYYPASNTWSSTQPTIYDSAANMTVGGIYGQGTFYYNSKHSAYFFVGQSQNGLMNVSYTVANTPEGPWSPMAEPVTLSTDFAYSFAAHPQMGHDPDQLYCSFTNNIDDPTVGNVYQQPLYLINFNGSSLAGVLSELL
ncbi:hypothetical protein BD324DRAFT_608491 [Kockovaella imperatae]|uniref:DUF4185 domain-containing protein n=1 Tax=Kockovaella imperatae TaxID=4999 RepID=A0A1Y1UGK3_9TREE|nr:hypothetical protein BD324DRAFT_608491 [Kockovaella imperatae]ORX37099.1 hypothetical protein BD324DRAFT_608491 [Kockovaella imperatae]